MALSNVANSNDQPMGDVVTKRSFVVGIVVGIAAVGLTACSSGGATSSPSTSAASASPSADKNACAAVNKVMSNLKLYGTKENVKKTLTEYANQTQGETKAAIEKLATSVTANNDADFDAAVAEFVRVCGKQTPDPILT